MSTSRQEADFTNFLSLLSRTKQVKKRQINRSGNTQIRDLLSSGFSGHHSLLLLILLGLVIRNICGPAIIFSLLFACVIGLLSGIGYAEFASRFKQKGSSYIYTYLSVGEFIAFLTSWSTLFSYTISIAILGRGISEYIDSLVDNDIQKFNEALFGTFVAPMIGSTLDILASFVVILVASGAASFIRDHQTVTQMLTRILNFMNLVIIVFVMIVGFMYADVKSWSSPANFLPYGKHGFLIGTSICFSIFFVLESLVSAGEKPSSSYTTPLGIILYIPVTLLATVVMSIMITFMVPYFKLSPQAQLISVFTVLNLKWAKYMVGIYGFSMMLFAMVELIYRMGALVSKVAHDKLLPTICAAKDCREIHVTNYTFPSFFAALLALFFDTSQLLDTLPIGPLLTTMSVTSAVLLVRYIPGVESVVEDEKMCSCCVSSKKASNFDYNKLSSRDENTNNNETRKPTVYSYRIAFTALVVIILCLTTILNLLMNHWSSLSTGTPWVCITLGVTTMIMFTTMAILLVQPKNGAVFPFMVPFVPLTPLFTISASLLLMLALPVMAWMRFLFWFFIGLFIYFLYGVHHSKA